MIRNDILRSLDVTRHSKDVKRGKRWHINRVLHQVDMFGKPIPAFNIKGENSVKSLAGGCLTLTIMGLVFTYAVIKGVQLINRSNPIMSEIMVPGYYSPIDMINLNEINFRMAFTIEGYLERKRKDDPKYVKLLGRLYGEKEGEYFQRMLEYHECTEEDFA